MLEGKFVYKNMISFLSKATESEILLLSQGLKFLIRPHRIDKAKLTQELKIFGR